MTEEEIVGRGMRLRHIAIVSFFDLSARQNSSAILVVRADMNLLMCRIKTLDIDCSAGSQNLDALRRREEEERISWPYLGASAITLLYDQGERQRHLVCAHGTHREHVTNCTEMLNFISL